MTRLLVALAALVLVACGPAVPATREGHCERGSSELALPRYALCTPDSPNRCARPMECRAWFPGEQAFCDIDTGVTRRSPFPCERCPAGWECRDYDNPSVDSPGDPMRWCFPGPVCGSEAGASDASADG